jgi:hypothetical protein
VFFVKKSVDKSFGKTMPPPFSLGKAAVKQCKRNVKPLLATSERFTFEA